MLWDVLGGVDTETAYMKDRQAFPWHPSRNTRGQTICMTDKPSPSTPLGVPEDRLQVRWTSLPLVPLSEYQRIDYMKDRQASPWCTPLGMPEDRLDVGQTKPSSSVPFSECQRTDYMHVHSALALALLTVVLLQSIIIIVT